MEDENKKVDEKVKLFDGNDRFFTLENGLMIELKANEPKEVSKEVADELLAKYPYLKIVE